MKPLFYIVIAVILLGCNKEPQLTLVFNPEPFCLTSSPVHGVLPIGDGCDTAQMAANSDPSFWCDLVHVDTIYLSEISKCWIPQFKYDVGKKFEYRNEQGQTLELTLTEKDHVLAQDILGGEQCDSSIYKIGLCYDLETYYILLENEEEKIELYIEMGIELFRLENPDFNGKPDIILKILKITPTSVGGWGLRAEEFDNSPYILSNFEEEMVLQDKKFINVYSAGRYLYTKEIGLIAFIDDNQTQWVLQE